MSSTFGGFHGGSFSAPRDPLSLPHLQDYEGVDPRTDSTVFWRSPWLWPSMVRDDALVNSYALAGELPGQLPYAAVFSDDWRRRCVMASQDLWSSDPHASQAALRSAFTKLVYQRPYRFPGHEPIPASLGLDLWVFRTAGEVEYGYNLASLDWNQWKGRVRPDDAALCFDRPILRADFRYVRRYEVASDFWERVKWERRTRSRSGYLVPYHCIEIDMVRRNARRSRYVAVPSAFSRGEVEVPRGFLADLPPVLSYKSSELIMNSSETGLWVVFYSEWTAKVAASLLWEAYDHFRVWFLPPSLRQMMRDLDLAFVLGSTSNYRDLMHFLTVIDETDWSRVPLEWSQRGTRSLAQDASPGRHCASAGDYIFYDPWQRCRLEGRVEAARARMEAPSRPFDQPTGYFFDEEIGNHTGSDVASDGDGSARDTAPQTASGVPDSTPAGPAQTSSGNNVVPVASGAPASLVTLEEHVQVIRHFLASAGVGSSSLQGDVASMRDLVSNLIAGNSATVARNSVSTTTAPLNDDGDINN